MTVEINKEKTHVEEMTINRDDVLNKVKGVVEAGNARRIIIKTDAGKVLVEIPLTVGVAGGAALLLFAPVLTLLAGAVAVATRLTLVVERVEPQESEQVTKTI